MFKKNNTKNTEKQKLIKKLVFFIILDILAFSVAAKYDSNNYLKWYICARMIIFLLPFLQTIIILLKYLIKTISMLIDDRDEDYETYQFGYLSISKNFSTILILCLEVSILGEIMRPLLINFREMAANNLVPIKTLICLLSFQIIINLVEFRVKSKISEFNISN